jgi:ribonuclease PH
VTCEDQGSVRRSNKERKERGREKGKEGRTKEIYRSIIRAWHITSRSTT